MAIQKENSAPTTAIFTHVLKVVKLMTDEQFKAEKLYQTSLSIAHSMLKKDLITPEEFDAIGKLLLEKYRPILGTLFSHIRLTL